MTVKVLYVEDERLDQTAFTRLVEKSALPYDCVIATTVSEGLAFLETDTFDVVIVDYRLPDGTGFDILKALPNHIASIFVTGAGSEVTAIRALRAGASDYLIKDSTRLYLNFIPLTIERVVQQKESERELRTLSQAVMSSSDGIYITDMSENITHVNRAFCDIYGYTAQEIIGQSSRCLLADSAAPAAGKKISDDEECHQKRDGQTFPVTLSRTLVEDDEGLPFAYVSIVRDFSDLKQLIAERDNLIEQLDSFAHTVAHDLRNPASVVFSYASLLATDYETLDKQDIKQGLASMERVAAQMNRIIEALLLLAGTQGIENVPIDELAMPTLVSEAITRVENLVAKYSATITLATDFPVARGYAPWVEEMLVNYISNALKYGARPPVVTIGAERMADGMIRYWVRDNGQGLRPDQQAQLFQPFKRLNRPGIDGHGLGLAIVLQITERLGGAVSVTSEVGVGSEFSFTLPTEIVNEQTLPEAEPDRPVEFHTSPLIAP